MYKTGFSLAATGAAGWAAHSMKIGSVPVPVAAGVVAGLIAVGALILRAHAKLQRASQPEATKR